MFIYNNFSGALLGKFDVSGFEIKKIRANCDESNMVIIDANSKILVYDLHAILKSVNNKDINEANFLIYTISRFKSDIIDLVFSAHDKDLMHVLCKDKSVTLCTLKGHVLKTIVVEQSPVCIAIDNLDTNIVLGCDAGEICLISLSEGTGGQEEGFSKPSQNSANPAYILTKGKLNIKNSQVKTEVIQIHSKRVNTICYVLEDQRFISSGDDNCIHSFSKEGKIFSSVKNLKTPYYYLQVIDRQLIQESTAVNFKKNKQRAKVFKSFHKIINKADVPSEVVCLSRSKRIVKHKDDKVSNLKQILGYIYCQMKTKTEKEAEENKNGESDELMKLRQENEKLKTVNSKLLKICVTMEDNTCAEIN